MLSSPIISTFSEDSWDAASVVEEAHVELLPLKQNDAYILTTLTNKKTDNHAEESSLRTDPVIRHRIIIGACLGSFLFLVVIGLLVGCFAA